MTATVSALPLSLGAPYVAQFLEPTLAGTLNAAVGVKWVLGANLPALQKEKGAHYELKLTVDRLSLDKLALNQGKAALASVQAIELLDAQLDPVAQSVSLGKLSVTNPRVKVERDAGGRWMVEQWLKGGETRAAAGGPGVAPPVAAAPAPAPAADKPAASPWKVAVNDFLLQGGTLGWSDAAMARPVAFEVSALRVQLKNFALDAKKPASLEVGARLGTGRADPGRLSYRGTVGLNPVSAQGTVDVVNLPVHAFEPYFGDLLNIELLRADASFKGSVQFAALPAGPQLRLTGDSAVESLRANSVAGTAAAGARPGAAAGSGTPTRAGTSGDEELLAWKALNLRGIDVALAPGAPARVDVRETVLSDFYARVILSEEGRLNLQDLVKSQPGAADFFIKPNYSADLSELTGKLSAFSSVKRPAARPCWPTWSCAGRAEGTASLEVTGKLNPLAKPLALDIKGKVRDLELPPLTPYSVKYAGHGIERGKLSMDVAYTVLPNGQLTASNRWCSTS
jgi:hypothetical protein